MRRTLLIIVAALAATTIAGAQTWSEAYQFSENNYYGTARSMAMGNAFTALGGDLGSIGINPAGSAVNSYSQFTITPNLSIVATSSDYNGSPSSTSSYEAAIRNSRARFTIPNFGLTLNLKTGRTYGLKNVSLGFVGNATNNYTDNMITGGSNNGATTFFGELASYADGYSGLGSASWYGSTPWDVMVGYNSGMIATYGDYDNAYVGVTERIFDDGTIETAGILNQRYERVRTGGKYDFVFNVGFNISDMLFFGCNLGLTTVTSSFSSSYREYTDGIDPNFTIDYSDGTSATFMSARYRQILNIEGSGVYGKFGLIFVPVPGIRVGAAIQTPTCTYLSEVYQVAGETHFSDSGFDAYSTSPESTYDYKLISPYRANVGIAVTGVLGALSMDYEVCDYSTMKFRERGTKDNSAFYSVNDEIREYMGAAHTIRIGGELKATPEFAFRAGYNFTTSAERYYDDYGNKTAPRAYTHVASIGAGYSSSGSFFCDFAFRATFKPAEYFYPYADYIEGVYSPEARIRTRLFDAVLTFGWRF